jgi:hypothetical protein
VWGLEREGSDAGPTGDAATSDAAPACWAAGEDGDEDIDRIDDGCDLCPADVDAAPADHDGDGVGDQCDPADGVANAIVVFDGFRKPADWKLVSGAWMRTDPDQGEFVQLNPSLPYAYAELTIPPVRYPTIDVRFTPGTAAITQCGAGAELVFPSTRISCIYEYRNDSDALVLYVNEQPMATSPFDAGGAIRIQLSSLPNGTAQCQAVSSSPSAPLTVPVAVPAATVNVGLVTKADTARFHSMTIFATP